MRAIAVLVCCGILLACSATGTPPDIGGVPSRALSIDNRGGPPIIVKVGSIELARVACGISALVTLDEPGVPPLPWSLSVVKQSDGTVLLTATVTDLPRWLVIAGEDASIASVQDDAMSPGPPCPSGP